MKKNLFKFGSVFSLLFLFPFFAFAAAATNITDILVNIKAVLNAAIPVLVALGLIYFIWGVIRYVISSEEEDKKKGRDVMVYGLIGLAAIIGVWGLANLIIKTLVGDAALTAPSTPAFGNACDGVAGNTIQGIADTITCIINSSAIPLVFALALVMFIWGVVKYFIIDAGEEAKRTEGKQFMIWGLVALAVMISVWALVGVLTGTFGFTFDALPKVRPQSNPH